MSKPPLREQLFVDGPAGRLEVLLEIPARVDTQGLAVICHPHPLHGGAMTNKVAHTLARVANELGFAAYRFNFRGVGQSDGEHDDGRGEVEDARAVLAAARRRFDGRVLLAGFSFGAMVAIELAVSEDPAALISIAPPTSRFAGNTAWSPPACRWLIVHGDADELVPVDATLEWVNQLPPGPELHVMEGVDHFFHGNLVRLRQLLIESLSAEN